MIDRMVVDLVDAQEALASGSWSRAGSALRAALAEGDDGRVHEGLAQVAWWTDDADTCLRERETAYRRCREDGDQVGAARSATALAWDSLIFGCGRPVALGWLGLAAELLAGLGELPEHGWQLVREGELALSADHDPDRARERAGLAAEVGRRTGDGDLVVVGRALEGLALVRLGEIEAGMTLLDPAAAAATSGDVTDLMWTGKVLCWLISACHETWDVPRAQDWCARVAQLCHERHLDPLLHVCRIEYAAVQVSAGAWPAADRELTDTLVRLDRSRRPSRVQAIVQLGELRRLQGRLAEAEQLFRQAEFAPGAVLGLALIRHARGESESAWSSLQRLLGTLGRDNRLARAEFLLPAVRLAHAVGFDDAAADAAGELTLTAAAVGTEALLAMSAMADAVLAGPSDTARLLHDAVRHYHRAGLRHGEAESRMLLAAVLAGRSDASGAREQLRTAVEVLTELSDTAGLERARALGRRLDVGRATVLTPREVEVLRLLARGASNEEVATALTLSPHTVHRHVANILTKLDQPTRAGAVGVALTSGIL